MMKPTNSHSLRRGLPNCLKVSLNGVKLCTAGGAGLTAITASIIYAKGENCDYLTKSPPIHMSVRGESRKKKFRWINCELRTGDMIRFEPIQSATADLASEWMDMSSSRAVRAMRRNAAETYLENQHIGVSREEKILSSSSASSLLDYLELWRQTSARKVVLPELSVQFNRHRPLKAGSRDITVIVFNILLRPRERTHLEVFGYTASRDIKLQKEMGVFSGDVIRVRVLRGSD